MGKKVVDWGLLIGKKETWQFPNCLSKNVDFALKIYISDSCSTTVLKKWDVWIDEMDQGVGEVMGKHRADAEHIYCQSAPQYLRVHSGVLGR